MDKIKRHSRRVFIGVVGGSIVLIGLVLIPYPGPGWLIVFAGLAILATEFEAAARVRDRIAEKYDAWVAWLKRQHWTIQVLSLAATGLMVVLTLWLLNTFGLINDFLRLGWDWLRSPFFW